MIMTIIILVLVIEYVNINVIINKSSKPCNFDKLYSYSFL